MNPKTYKKLEKLQRNVQKAHDKILNDECQKLQKEYNIEKKDAEMLILLAFHKVLQKYGDKMTDEFFKKMKNGEATLDDIPVVKKLKNGELLSEKDLVGYILLLNMGLLE